jgi:Strictosidine synthase-like, N-terminal
MPTHCVTASSRVALPLVVPRGFGPARLRDCVNVRGTRGCLRDRRLGDRADLAIAPDGGILYSVTPSTRDEPLVSPLAPDGSVHRSLRPGRVPTVDGPEVVAVGRDGRVYAAGHSDGFFIYAPERRSHRLRTVACWTMFGDSPCEPSARLVGVPGALAPAPSGSAVYLAEGGVLTVHPPPK